MGLEDRDYYREDYAEKNGKRYDKKTGRYHDKQSAWYDPKQYRIEAASASALPPDMPGANWPWYYQFLALVAMTLAAFGAYMLVSVYKSKTAPVAEQPRPAVFKETKPTPPVIDAERYQRWESSQREEQQERKAMAAEQARMQKREAEWNRYFKPSAACRDNPVTVDCANEHIRARRAFDERR